MPRESVIEYYDECHGDYRRIWDIERTLSMHYGFHDAEHRTRDAAVENMNRQLARIARIRSGERVMDAGCGLGGSSIWLARNFRAQVVAVNIQEMQVRLARDFAQRAGVADLVRFEVADYTKTPLPDASVDVVWAIESLCHADDKRAFVAEARRVLRPGGRLVVADGFLVKQRPSRRDVAQMRDFLKGWAIPNLPFRDEFLAHLAEAGFSHTRFDDVTRNVMPSSRRLWRASLLSAPITRYREWTGRRSHLEALNRRAAALQYRTLRRRIWAYGIVVGEVGLA